MRKFTDENGHDWVLQITTPDVLQVRTDVGVDLLDAELFPRLITDYVLLVQVLWTLCERQATARQIDADQFGRMFAGELLEQAAAAFFESLIDFFPPRRQEMFRAALHKAQQLERASIEHGLNTIRSGRMDALLQEHLRTLEENLAQTFCGGDSGGSQGSSASTSRPPG